MYNESGSSHQNVQIASSYDVVLVQYLKNSLTQSGRISQYYKHLRKFLIKIQCITLKCNYFSQIFYKTQTRSVIRPMIDAFYLSF